MDATREKLLGQAVGAAIAQARAASGLTQDQVAESLAVGPEAISRMERGVVIPSLPRLVEFAELFGCPVESLLKRGSHRSQDHALLIQEMMESLDESDRTFVLGVVDQTCRHLSSRGQRSSIRKN